MVGTLLLFGTLVPRNEVNMNAGLQPGVGGNVSVVAVD